MGAFLALGISLAIGALNGFLVTRTGIDSFLITLAAFLMLQGLNLAVTKLVTGQVATPTIADMEGFPSAHAANLARKAKEGYREAFDTES